MTNDPITDRVCTECGKVHLSVYLVEKKHVCVSCLIKSYENVKAAKKHLDAYGHLADNIMNAKDEDLLSDAMEEWEEAMTLLYGGKTTPSTRCSVEDCEKAATFDSPKDFCDRHWFEWWDQDLMERNEIIKDRCEVILSKQGETGDKPAMELAQWILDTLDKETNKIEELEKE